MSQAVYYVAVVHRHTSSWVRLTQTSRYVRTWVEALALARYYPGVVVRETADTITLYQGY